MELITARREPLLRVPGIGPVGAETLLKARRLGRLSSLHNLYMPGIRTPEQAPPYFAGWQKTNRTTPALLLATETDTLSAHHSSYAERDQIE